MFQKIFRAIFMATIAYMGIFALSFTGIDFSPVIFTEVGLIVVFMLALTYTFYFRL